ncbi:tetraspanin-4-like isoform X1 [Lethenteron reissneri]|uniref:tetraspanin-4-like isoform X1 n=2 Tax=Lethenteron reissneri TaxID=7753 RepID=UPI002AB7D27C|nr:tetraspanin-4-like isoform X1 [Lethenteron reissneri]
MNHSDSADSAGTPSDSPSLDSQDFDERGGGGDGEVDGDGGSFHRYSGFYAAGAQCPAGSTFAGVRAGTGAGAKETGRGLAKGPSKYVVFYLDLSFVFLLEFKRCNMAQSCIYCLKYLMFIFNLVFWLGGCGILGVGIWLSVTQGNFATLSPAFPLLTAANLLIAGGTIMMIVGFLGCLGAIKENRALLLTFFILLLIIFTLQLIGGILFIVYEDVIDSYAQKDLIHGLKLYGQQGNVGLTNAWNIVQTDFHCCGVGNYTDWFDVFKKKQVPDSCCLEYSNGCGSILTSITNINSGCYDKVKVWLQEHLMVVGIFGLCIALIQVLGMAFAMIMYCQLRSESKFYD